MIRPIISITTLNVNKEPAVVTKFIIKDTIYAIKVTTRTLKKRYAYTNNPNNQINRYRGYNPYNYKTYYYINILSFAFFT